MKNQSKKTILDHILSSAIPYTKENLTLAYNPGKFFWELEQIQKESAASKGTIAATISRAKKEGYLKKVELENQQKVLQLTLKGKIKISKHLDSPNIKDWDQKWRIILFDIPEQHIQYFIGDSIKGREDLKKAFGLS